MIRFDRDGDAYVLQNVTAIDAQGKELGWTNRTALLLHSRDGLHTWTAYAVPGGRCANFEKLEGHNASALERPPVILNGDIGYFPGSDPKAYLVLPGKNSDGTLRFGIHQYAENAIVGNMHFGDGNLAISVGDKIYIVWGWCPSSAGYPEIAKTLATAEGDGTVGRWGGGAWVWSALRSTALGATLPPIPEDHPAFALTFRHFKKSPRSEPCYARNGVPTFVTVFDRQTKAFAPPVFVGFGGYTLDGHNWGAITVDSKGYLTVLINGHHDPLTVTRSLRPLDATAWSAPAYIHGDHDRISYATLTCDAGDTLYSVDRSTSDAYNNSLSLLRRKAGGAWEPERILVWPAKYMYMAWAHRMTYDRTRDRLFLTYFCNDSGQQLTVDQYEFFIFQHPDQEPKVAQNQGATGNNPGRILPYPDPLSRSGGSFYPPEVGDCAVLVSGDHGETWHLATTEDFDLTAKARE